MNSQVHTAEINATMNSSTVTVLLVMRSIRHQVIPGDCTYVYTV